MPDAEMQYPQIIRSEAMKKFGFLVAVTIAFLFWLMLGACGNQNVTGISDELPRELTVLEKKLVERDNRFSIDLFKQTNALDAKKNVILSPLSASFALAMTLNGANHATRDSMIYALRLDDMQESEINQSYRSLIDLLLNLDPKVIMEIANAIFYKENYGFEQEFLDINRKYFDAEVRGLNFFDPGAPGIINGWVKDKTRGKIEKIVDSIDPRDVMFLINAIYFKGTWLYQFDKTKTQDDQFRLEDGSTRDVKMMMQTAYLDYLANDEIEAVDLPYGGGAFRMTVVLPRTGQSINAFIAGLTAEKWQTWMNSFGKDSVTVHLPRFKLRYDTKLNQPLSGMGMGIAFDPQRADFTRMYKNGGLYISYVRQNTYVEVNEEGTEAAAVTVVGIRETSIGPSGPKLFRVDRPFLFVIREKNSGTILFIGKVLDPTAG